MEKLKLYKDQEITIYELSKKTNVSRKVLYQYAKKEKNIDNMKIVNLLKISTVVGVTLEELYFKIKDYQTK